MSKIPASKKTSFKYGDYELTLETGTIARQATSVRVTVGKTVILVTLVAAKQPNPEVNFLPLSVYYQEPRFSIGRIPGGHYKREGRPSEREILISRAIDRVLRPLFPKHFNHEVQVFAVVLSSDGRIPTDIPAILGASAALAISGLPCLGPVAAVRVGFADGACIFNPIQTQLFDSELDLLVAGTEKAVFMIESEANQVPHKQMLDAIWEGHAHMQVAIQAIKEFAQMASESPWDWKFSELSQSTVDHLKSLVTEHHIGELFEIQNSAHYKSRKNELRSQISNQLLEKFPESPLTQLESLFDDVVSKQIRDRILSNKIRLDGRSVETIREITIETGLLPCAHGSALFSRYSDNSGKGTQVLAIVTLGTEKDAQIIDGLEGDRRETFMLHYNFPPYCVGETGQVGSPKRREIGHGNLANRALQAILPTETELPLVIQLTAMVTESNGSSSMATTTAGSLALMAAGVPTKGHVGALAMSVIKGEQNNFVVLSDISADEDHFGDMDFKIAGTLTGITALQMDIKTDGINKEIMESVFNQAIEGLGHIISKMNAVISAPREISPNAPRVVSLQISIDKIRDVIGKGGVTIRSITEETNTRIDISDSGLVRISGLDELSCQQALERVKYLTAEAEVGMHYTGCITGVMNAGAFVSILPGRDGFLAASQIIPAVTREQHISDVLTKGQTITVKVLGIDRQGRVQLTMKDVEIAE